MEILVKPLLRLRRPMILRPAGCISHPARFLAESGVREPVQMTIDLPKTASLGYYYAVVFKPNISAQPNTPTTNIIKGSNAILVLVDTQSANENRQIEIASLSVGKRIYEYLPTTFTVSVRNTGNIFLAPAGNIFISKNSNITNTIDTLNVNPGGGNVLPGTTRDFQAVWTDGFPVYQNKVVNGKVVTNKKGIAVEQLNWNFANAGKFRIGKYYAQVTLVYNNGTESSLSPVLFHSGLFLINYCLSVWRSSSSSSLAYG